MGYFHIIYSINGILHIESKKVKLVDLFFHN